LCTPRDRPRAGRSELGVDEIERRAVAIEGAAFHAPPRDFADLSTARLLEWIYGRRVPPQFRRFLPLILIAFFAFLLVPNLLHRSHKSGLSDSERATRTIEAMKLIEAGEQSYKAVHGRFTQHLADLLPANSKLAGDLAVGLDVRLDVSTNGQSFLAQVASTVLSLVRAHSGATLSAQSCVVLKSSSGVNCPPPGR